MRKFSEGTTEVTRTVHFGIPTREERRAYTTVLRSVAALAMLTMPAVLPAAHADPVARAPLWAAKQDYGHPTGHGVGAALNRKEGKSSWHVQVSRKSVDIFESY